jgi:hypothetical protein
MYIHNVPIKYKLKVQYEPIINHILTHRHIYMYSLGNTYFHCTMIFHQYNDNMMLTS